MPRPLVQALYRHTPHLKPAISVLAGRLAAVCAMSDFLQPQRQQLSTSHKDADHHAHQVFLAFGSNLGDRQANIHRALRELEASSPTRVLDTSCLYESLPMYYHDQGRFLNGVVKASTALDPVQLLQAVKHVEHSLGRRKTIDNGPREVDLDILLFDDQVINDAVNDLIVPHQRIAEREFVLRPLADLITARKLPRFSQTPQALLSALKGPSELIRVNPITAAGLQAPQVAFSAEQPRAIHGHAIIVVAPSDIKSRQQGFAEGQVLAVDAAASDGPLIDGCWAYIDAARVQDRHWQQCSQSGEPVLLDVRRLDQQELSEMMARCTRSGIWKWQLVVLGTPEQARVGFSGSEQLPWVLQS